MAKPTHCSSCKKWKSGWCSRKKAAADGEDRACKYGERREEGK